MRPVPWWAVLSATLAPVFLIGGWTVAALLQPAGYRPVHDTISALAGFGATDRWVMTVGLAGLGACHLVTAIGLRPARRTGRALLGVGGVATALVAAFPLPREGTSTAHAVAAGIGFVTLAVWPVFAADRARLVVAGTATAVLLGLLCWFAFQLYGQGRLIGLTERLVAGAEAGWPLAAVYKIRTAVPGNGQSQPAR